MLDQSLLAFQIEVGLIAIKERNEKTVSGFSEKAEITSCHEPPVVLPTCQRRSGSRRQHVGPEGSIPPWLDCYTRGAPGIKGRKEKDRRPGRRHHSTADAALGRNRVGGFLVL